MGTACGARVCRPVLGVRAPRLQVRGVSHYRLKRTNFLRRIAAVTASWRASDAGVVDATPRPYVGVRLRTRGGDSSSSAAGAETHQMEMTVAQFKARDNAMGYQSCMRITHHD